MRTPAVVTRLTFPISRASFEAAQDLIDIYEYIAQDSLEAAERVRSQIYEAIVGLAATPGKGHRREDLTGRPVLFWPVRSYQIIYRAQPETLEIIAVPRTCFDSCLAISSFSTISTMTLDELLFSDFASATSFDFSDLSSLNDTVVSFTSPDGNQQRAGMTCWNICYRLFSRVPFIPQMPKPVGEGVSSQLAISGRACCIWDIGRLHFTAIANLAPGPGGSTRTTSPSPTT